MPILPGEVDAGDYQPRPEDIAKIRGSTVYKEVSSVEVELPRAQKTYTSSTVVVKELSRAVEIGSSIDSSRSKEAATQITESVVRNPDAMALKAMMNTVRMQGLLMSFSDVFLILTALFVLMACATPMIRRPRPGGAGADAH